MKVRATLLITFLSVANLLHAQIGGKNMSRMNTLLKLHGGSNNAQIYYQVKSGFIEQKLLGYIDHYTISDIKRIVVRDSKGVSTVELACDTTDACISHISPLNGTNIQATFYSFNTSNAANEFAKLADEIIRKDFGKKPYLVLTVDPSGGMPGGMQQVQEQDASNETAELKQKVIPVKPKKEGSHLSVDEYDETKSEDYIKSLSGFGQKIHTLRNIAEKGGLSSLKGVEEQDGAYVARIKLPKAKKNYISTFKSMDCFIAEFGTKKYYEDLEELYYELKDEIEEALPTDYEAIDMADEEIYENSNDEVFHTEFYSSDGGNKPSVVIRIAPDGKRNTLFLRIGKK